MGELKLKRSHLAILDLLDISDRRISSVEMTDGNGRPGGGSPIKLRELCHASYIDYKEPSSVSYGGGYAITDAGREALKKAREE